MEPREGPSQEGPREARRGQEEPGGARRGQEEPGGARRSQEGPGGARRSQEKPGGARRSHPNQFEECKTSLREGPKWLQGAPGGKGRAPWGPRPPGAPWVPPSNWVYSPQTG